MWTFYAIDANLKLLLHIQELLLNIHKVVTDIIIKVVGNSVGLWTSPYKALITSQQEEVILGEDHPVGSIIGTSYQ